MYLSDVVGGFTFSRLLLFGPHPQLHECFLEGTKGNDRSRKRIDDTDQQVITLDAHFHKLTPSDNKESIPLQQQQSSASGSFIGFGFLGVKFPMEISVRDVITVVTSFFEKRK